MKVTFSFSFSVSTMDKYNEINQGNYIDTLLNEGADKARYMARKKLAKVERKIGITIKK